MNTAPLNSSFTQVFGLPFRTRALRVSTPCKESGAQAHRRSGWTKCRTIYLVPSTMSFLKMFSMGQIRIHCSFCDPSPSGLRPTMRCCQVQQANSCLMQEWLHMARGHNKVEYCSGSHSKESGFRSMDLSLALALILGRGLRRIVARVRGVLAHLLHTAALWLAVTAALTSRA